ncbi:MAG TPA: amino acid-binding protein [Planctomycetes bacterium]|nr:amino acid-binding protein [Planctomycetota bacterium]
MKIRQLSVFMENKPGRLRQLCALLGESGINILTASLADTEQFGILRIIVKDWQNAKQILEGAGCVVKTTEVIAVEVPDTPGGLAEVLAVLDEAGMNIEYMYAFTFRRQDRAVIIFRLKALDQAIEVLARRGIAVIDGAAMHPKG